MSKMKSVDEFYPGLDKKDGFLTENRSSAPSSSRASIEFMKTEPCPRSVNEVYSLGIRFQGYIVDICLNLESLSKGTQKMQYKTLALEQLDVQAKIEELATDNLNQMLAYFYNNGGLVIDDPVSEKTAREIQPFYDKILNDCLNRLGAMANIASWGNAKADELRNVVNVSGTAMYTTLGKLYRAAEMRDAFSALNGIRG